MQQFKIKLILLALVLIGTFGCEKDILETRPGNTYSEADIYANIDLTQSLVDYTYNVTENWGLNVDNWWTRRIGIENASDETWFHFVPQGYRITRGQIQPNNMGFWTQKWSQYYRYIGTANDFLSKIDQSPVAQSDPERVATLKGEMKYLRANAYARLINLFGGVPLFDTPFELTDDFNIPRAAYQECVDFIVRELDEAVGLLPAGPRNGVEFGRVSRGACLAMKSRVLLYAASELHDPATAPNGPLYDYDKSNKWQEAADAAKAVIDLNEYSLVPVTTADDYQKLFLTPNSELIFARPFSPDFANTPGDFNTLPDKAQSPVGAGGWGLSNPTHNFVQDFKMANGLRIDAAGSGYDDADLYTNRELRFYANILYQGASFKGNELEYWSPGGTESREAPGPNHYAATGYNQRKFLDESIVIDQEQSASRPYPLARLPEIYLNYAEALYHLGREPEARTYVNLVAGRVGLPEITTSGEALLEDIQYERQMELFVEGHRFFDTRRWMMADRMNEDIMGIQWEKRNAAGELDPSGALTRLGPLLIEDRMFNPTFYYLPIPFAEVEKAGLEQNFGY
ncbi:RagB/SusD family nutrient uptake outer membrane protein [Neolewinella persica]|uniref:RagB/SusD family nutrient uptake outer membrane protein n=1 Tax=Neolewinella persica TaxID=70998 RepID=UPI000476B207|nr:RagB/SusD family nutrient uptake outer membrane protein [Neolewinella persica]